MASSVGRWNTCVSAPCQKRHEGELCNAAHDHILRAAEHHLEVLRLQGKAHAEHHDAKQVIDPRRLYHAERAGEEQGTRATTITMAAMYLPTKSLTFSSVFIIVSPFPSDMLWDKSIRKIKRPCPLRSVRDKGV